MQTDFCRPRDGIREQDGVFHLILHVFQPFQPLEYERLLSSFSTMYDADTGFGEVLGLFFTDSGGKSKTMDAVPGGGTSGKLRSECFVSARLRLLVYIALIKHLKFRLIQALRSSNAMKA